MTARFLLGLCALGLIACSHDDPATEPVSTSFSGTLIRVLDERPMEGIEVTLFEPVANAALGRTGAIAGPGAPTGRRANGSRL